jgi:hypothetical protein
MAQTITSSHTAAVAVQKQAPVGKRIESAKGSWVAKALLVASLAVAFIPGIGAAISYGIDRRRNRVVEKKQKEVLADYYRGPIAAQLGISPESVNVRDLELAAQVNPMIDSAIKKVTAEKKSANRAAVLSSAGSAAVGLIPGVNGLAKGALHLGGAVAGGMASSIFDKDVLMVHDMVEHIDAKLAAGEPVDFRDIVLLRIAQDEKWQADFKKQNKQPFHRLDPAAQDQVLASMPDILMGADMQAKGLNRGVITPQSLVMAGPESTSNFAANVASKSQGSFVSNETSRRLAAAQMQNSLN